jgi:hypothetical protein
MAPFNTTVLSVRYFTSGTDMSVEVTGLMLWAGRWLTAWHRTLVFQTANSSASFFGAAAFRSFT